jgi:outer membrane receptor for ferrienterochelin and colicins
VRLTRSGMLLLWIGCFSSLTASAEDTKEEPTYGAELTLEDLLTTVVTASKRSQTLATAPSIMSVITEQEIQLYGGRTVREVLERVVSVMGWSPFQFPQGPLSIRGDREEGPTHSVLLLLDGRPFRDSELGMDSPLMASLPVSAVERIEVIRGPGSVLFGTNAFTGVVNIITHHGAQRPTASVEYGSFGSAQVNLSGGANVGDLKVFGAARVENSDGWPFDYTDPNHVHNVEDFGDRQRGFVGNVRFRGFSLDATYDTLSQDYLGQTPVWPMEAPQRTRRLFANAGYFKEFNDKWNATLNLTYNRMQARLSNDPGPPVPFFQGNKAIIVQGPSNDLLPELTLQGKPSKDMNLLFGALLDHQSGGNDSAVVPVAPGQGVEIDTFSIKKYHRIRWGSYAQADYRIASKLTLVGGAQFVKPNNFSGQIIPRAGAILNVKSWGAKLLYGKAFRAPFASEDSILIPNVIVGNPDLKSPTLNTFDAQVFYETGKRKLAATFFFTRRKDQIVIVPATHRFENSPSSQTFHGFELEGSTKATSIVTFTGSYMHQSNYDATGDDNISTTPNDLLKLGVALGPHRGMTLGLFNTYYSAWHLPPVVAVTANPPPDSADLLSGHLSLDLPMLFAGHKAAHTVLFSLHATNLFDVAVYEPEDQGRINSIPGRPGRAIYAEVSVKY